MKGLNILDFLMINFLFVFVLIFFLNILDFDFGCIATLEVDIMYNQIMKGTIMKTQKTDKSI